MRVCHRYILEREKGYYWQQLKKTYFYKNIVCLRGDVIIAKQYSQTAEIKVFERYMENVKDMRGM